MDKYFLLYSSAEGPEFKECPSEATALGLIEDLLKTGVLPTYATNEKGDRPYQLEDFTLIQGRKVRLTSVTTITKVAIDRKPL